MFTEEAISGEVLEFVYDLERQIANLPNLSGQPAHVIRQARKDGIGIFGVAPTSDRAVTRTISGSGGGIPVRIIQPEGQVRGVYLHFHGGGWTLGEASDQDERLEAIADRHGLITFSVDYRLAPEDPYPAGPDDCEAAAAWLVEHAQTEFGTETIIIGGESAGGHLAAVTLLRMRARHGYTGFTGANLVYGAYDLSMTPSTRNWGDRNLILNTAVVSWFTDQFVPAERCDDPDVSPLHADLSDMPRALFTVGTLDPLLDDSLFMAQRWLAAGNAAELVIYPGGIHAFDYFETAQAVESHNRTARFFDDIL